MHLLHSCVTDTGKTIHFSSTGDVTLYGKISMMKIQHNSLHAIFEVVN